MNVECGPGKTEAHTIHESLHCELFQFVLPLKFNNIVFLEANTTLTQKVFNILKVQYKCKERWIQNFDDAFYSSFTCAISDF